jgi:hypothetical protein
MLTNDSDLTKVSLSAGSPAVPSDETSFHAISLESGLPVVSIGRALSTEDVAQFIAGEESSPASA